MPNFKEMSLVELRQYILANRRDKEAWREFRDRPRPNGITISADTPPEAMERILREAINRKD
ncbi:MAG TPA: hypothetical protein ACFCUY_11930 [Xenococcaceae cyanobacterium]